MPYTNQTPVALCIPRIEEGITENFVREIFSALDIGTIKSIIICKTNNSSGRKAFINLTGWKDNSNAKRVKYRLANDLAVNIMYQIPWYWKLKLAYSN